MAWPDWNAHVDIAERSIREAQRLGAATGYAHPLGFDHVSLPGPTGWKLRLHAWRTPGSNVQVSTPQIHNHAFRFSSLVLQGEVRHTPYQVQVYPSASNRGRQRLLRVAPTGPVTRLVDAGVRVDIRAERSKSYGTGELYSFEEGAYHVSSSVGPDPAITFLLAEKRQGVISYVVSSKQTSSDEWRRVLLSSDYVSSLLETATSRLCELRALSRQG